MVVGKPNSGDAYEDLRSSFESMRYGKLATIAKKYGVFTEGVEQSVLILRLVELRDRFLMKTPASTHEITPQGGKISLANCQAILAFLKTVEVEVQNRMLLRSQWEGISNDITLREFSDLRYQENNALLECDTTSLYWKLAVRESRDLKRATALLMKTDLTTLKNICLACSLSSRGSEEELRERLIEDMYGPKESNVLPLLFDCSDLFKLDKPVHSNKVKNAQRSKRPAARQRPNEEKEAIARNSPKRLKAEGSQDTSGVTDGCQDTPREDGNVPRCSETKTKASPPSLMEKNTPAGDSDAARSGKKSEESQGQPHTQPPFGESPSSGVGELYSSAPSSQPSSRLTQRANALPCQIDSPKRTATSPDMIQGSPKSNINTCDDPLDDKKSHSRIYKPNNAKSPSPARRRFARKSPSQSPVKISSAAMKKMEQFLADDDEL